jgi:hypothetical protein
MTQIRVGLINPQETQKLNMMIPDDVPVRDLTREMVEVLGLPLTDLPRVKSPDDVHVQQITQDILESVKGQPLPDLESAVARALTLYSGRRIEAGLEGFRVPLGYSLNAISEDGSLRRLKEDTTLEENGVQSGSILKLVAAGGKGGGDDDGEDDVDIDEPEEGDGEEEEEEEDEAEEEEDVAIEIIAVSSLTGIVIEKIETPAGLTGSQGQQSQQHEEGQRSTLEMIQGSLQVMEEQIKKQQQQIEEQDKQIKILFEHNQELREQASRVLSGARASAMSHEKPVPQVSYLDFDLSFSGSVSEGRAKASWVDQRKKMEGDHPFQMPISLDDLDRKYLRNMGLPSRRGTSVGKLAKELGEKLFQTIFAGDVRDCFRACQSQARSADWGVRIRLDFRRNPSLNNYPWEFLWNEEDGFLARSRFTPVVRYLPSAKLPRALQVVPPFRMLVVTATAPNYPHLNIDQEKENLKQALSGLTSANLLVIEWLDQPTPTKLREILRENLDYFHVLHYIGHGDVSEDQGGYLVLEREPGTGNTVTGDQFSDLLRDCRQMRLVTLNTCHGGRMPGDDSFASIAIELARAQMPAVVAMQHEIQDRTAIVFSREFYSRLTGGWSIYTAMSEARMALFFDHGAGIEWAIPVLYSRSPKGVIFKRPGSDS